MHSTIRLTLGSMLLMACTMPTTPTSTSADDTAKSAGLDMRSPRRDYARPTDTTGAEHSGGSADQPQQAPPLGWLAKGATFDETTPAFSAAINPLLLGQHPIAIGVVEDAQGEWWVRPSATIPIGNAFMIPAEHPCAPAALALSQTDLVSAPSHHAWIEVLDASSVLVWIPIEHALVHGTFVTGALNQLADGELDAIVSLSAAGIHVQTTMGAFTIGELLGDPTSHAPAGWRVHLRFDATAAIVLF
jgi:hypothetical protein